MKERKEWLSTSQNKMVKKTWRALNSRLCPYLCSKEDETRDRRQSHVSPGRHG